MADLVRWSNQGKKLEVRKPLTPAPRVVVAPNQRLQPPPPPAAPKGIAKVGAFTKNLGNALLSPIKGDVELVKAAVGTATGNLGARDRALERAGKEFLTVPKMLVEGAVEGPRQVGEGIAYGWGGDVKKAEKAQQSALDLLGKQKIEILKKAKQGFSSPEEQARYEKFAKTVWETENSLRQQQMTDQTNRIEELDPQRNIFAIGDSILTAMTFGVAGVTTNGVRLATASAFEKAIASGATKEVATQIAKTAGKKELVRLTLINASMGGASGAMSPYISAPTGTVTPLDVALGATAGATIGGALPGAVVGTKRAIKWHNAQSSRGTLQLPGGKDPNQLESLKQEARKYEKADVDEALKYKNVYDYIDAKHNSDLVEKAVNELERQIESRKGIMPSDSALETIASYRKIDADSLKKAYAARPENDKKLADFYTKAQSRPTKTKVAPQVSKTPLAKDEMILYHRTSKANADELAKTGKMYSKENTGEVFLSNRPDEQILGYGDTVVPIKVKKSDIRLDDEFPSGEQHFAVKADRATPIFDTTPTPQVSKTAKLTPAETNLQRIAKDVLGDDADAWLEQYKAIKQQHADKPKTEIKVGAVISGEDEVKHTITQKHIDGATKVVAAAAKQDPAFQKQVSNTAKELGLKYFSGPVKKVPRVVEKTVTDYGGDFERMKDLSRGTIILDNPADINKVIDRFKKEYDIFEIKDTINATFVGYKDTKIITRNGSVLRETIIATPEMLTAKNDLDGHNLYDQVRIKEGDWQSTAKVMDRLYDESTSLTLSRVSSKPGTSASVIGAPTALARNGAKPPPVNKLVPKTSPVDVSKSTLTGKPSTSKKSGNLFAIDDNPSTNRVPLKTPVVKPTTDRYGNSYVETEAPTKLLKRDQRYQPRTTESGKGTEDSVYKKGYNEGVVDQPLLLWKKDGEYIVLGGHSRTRGLERRATEGLPNPENVKARVYEDITDAQAREISRGANQGGQYENTLDMAKSISESIKDGVAPSVQRQNMIKGYTYDDYQYLWDTVKGHTLLKNKIAEGGISTEDVLAVARHGRNKGIPADKVAGIVYGLDKDGKFSKQNATNVISVLSGKIKAGINRDAQTGLFGTVEQAINATDLLKEHQLVSDELIKKRNVLLQATKDAGVSAGTKKELTKLVTEYNKKLQSIETEIINAYHAKQKKNIPETKGTGPNKVPLKKKIATPVADNERRRGFVDTVLKNANTPEGTKELLADLDAVYKVRNTADHKIRAANFVRKHRDKAMEIASDPKDDVGVFIGNEMITQLQKEGQYTQATALINTMAKALTESGRMSQAASAYGQLTPTGALRFTQQQIDAYNKVTKKVLRKNDIVLKETDAKKISDMAEELQKMPENTPKQQRAKTVATKKMLKAIQETMPATAAQRISTLQTMAMLLNPKTLIRNIGGNLMFGGMEQVSQAIGAPIDKLLGTVTGKRTVGLPGARTQAKAGYKGLKTGYKEAKQGINTGPDTQYDLPSTRTFRGKTLGGAEAAMNVGLRGPDRAFYEGAYEDTLRSLMKINKVTKPEQWMVDEAIHTGLYRTFQDNSISAQVFVGMKRSLNKIGIGTKGKRFGLGDLVLKFPKTPGNLLARGLDYSPVGFAKALFQASKPAIGKEFDQRKFVNSFSRAVVGSSMAFGLGYVLADLGIVTAKPEKDKDLRNLQKASGQGGYQINVTALKRFVLSGFDRDSAKLAKGDVLVTYDWAQPMAIPFTAGAATGDGQKPGDAAQSGFSTALDALNSLVEQPMLRGIQKLVGGYNGIIDPAIGVATDAVAGFVPTISNQINQTFDNSTRETYDPNPIKQGFNKAKAKIPIAAQTLPKQYTTLGKENERFQGGSNNLFNVFLNPSFITNYNPDKVAQLPLDIFNNSGLTTQVPRTVTKTITINGETKVLTGREMQDYQKAVGKMTSKSFEALLRTPEFMKLSDAEKAKKMSAIMSDINSAVKITMFGDKGYGTDSYNFNKLDTGVKNILKGKTPTYSQEQIDKDTKAKAKTDIYSKYSTEVQDFYKLTKAEQSAMFAEDREKATALYDASKLMDGELVNAGVIKEPKYKTKKAKTAKAKSSRSSTRRKVAKKKAPKASVASIPKIKIASSTVIRPKSVTVKKPTAPRFASSGTRKLSVSKIPSNYLTKKIV
jgi:hypothetical protein